MTIRHAALALTVAVLAPADAVAQQASTPAPGGDCLPNRPALVQARIDAVTAAPTFLPKLELARCYDLAWRMADVEPAILNALAALRVEARTSQATPAPLPVAALAGVEVPVPTPMTAVTPEYPTKAYLDNVSGLVIVEAVIGKDGTVRQARAVESVAGLDEAVVRAVKQWRFVPTNKSGQMVDVVAYFPVKVGQTRVLWASDWLQVARFHFTRGLPQLAEAALDSARDRAQRDYDRYGEISGVTGTAGRLAVPPTRLMSVPPMYPPAALRAGVSGVVSLQVLVDRFGDVGRVVVLRPVPMLDMAAQESVMRWKFMPAQANGQPVSASMSTLVTFNRR
jgi:TonB family protein